jgi:ribosome-binding ATPase YchF (GTP1/OBG family)
LSIYKHARGNTQEEARVQVPDWRVDWLAETYKSKTKIPAVLTCFDIAGLTKGASTGAGLGNSFLSHVRAVDGIFQIVRECACIMDGWTKLSPVSDTTRFGHAYD